MIEISHLNKVWRSGARTVTALDDVSLRIAAGSIFGIIGRSGAGKSTLLRTLNLLERPTSGSIRMDGQEITTLPHAELLKLRQQTGVRQHRLAAESHRPDSGRRRAARARAGTA